MNSEQHNEPSPQYRPVTLADLLGKKVKLVSHGVEKIIHVETDLGDGKVEVRNGDNKTPPSFEYFTVDSAIEPGVEVYVNCHREKTLNQIEEGMFIEVLDSKWFCKGHNEFGMPLLMQLDAQWSTVQTQAFTHDELNDATWSYTYQGKYGPFVKDEHDVGGEQIPIDSPPAPPPPPPKRLLPCKGNSNIPARPFGRSGKLQRRVEAALFFGTIGMCLIGMILCLAVGILKP